MYLQKDTQNENNKTQTNYIFHGCPDAFGHDKPNFIITDLSDLPAGFMDSSHIVLI